MKDAAADFWNYLSCVVEMMHAPRTRRKLLFKLNFNVFIYTRTMYMFTYL